MFGGEAAVRRSALIKNRKGHKLRTYILVENSLVDYNMHFPRDQKGSILIISRASGNVKGLLKHLCLTLEAHNYSK